MWIIRDREAGNVIEKYDTYKEAKEALDIFEGMDKEEGTYEENFYEIVSDMSVEKAKSQREELMKLLDTLKESADRLFSTCHKECEGMSTHDSNIVYNRDYAETQNAIKYSLSVLAERYYELGLIVKE